MARRAPFVAAVRSAPQIGREELALAIDLSETGMRLRRCASPHAYTEARVVELEFELPDGGAPIRVEGCFEFEGVDGSYRAAGVRFVALERADEARIARYVASTT